MKKSLSLLLIMGVMLTGCTSLTQPQKQRIETVTFVAASIGTASILQEHPEWRGGFVQAVADLKVLESQPADIISLMEIVKRLPVKELKASSSAIYIEAATMVLTDQFGATPIDQIENLKPYIIQLRKGIERGLVQ